MIDIRMPAGIVKAQGISWFGKAIYSAIRGGIESYQELFVIFGESGLTQTLGDLVDAGLITGNHEQGWQPCRRTIPVRSLAEQQSDKPHPLIEYWNQLPRTAKHRPGTKLYANLKNLLGMLKAGDFKHLQLDPGWAEHHGVTEELSARKWNNHDIKTAMSAAALLLLPGYNPDDKSWVPKDLATMCYNPRRHTSWLLACYITPPQPSSKGAAEARFRGLSKQQQMAFNRLSNTIERMRSRPLSDRERTDLMIIVEELAIFHKTIPVDRSQALADWLGDLVKLAKEYAQFIETTYAGLDIDARVFAIDSKPWRRFVESIENNIQVSIKSGRTL